MNIVKKISKIRVGEIKEGGRGRQKNDLVRIMKEDIGYVK